MKDDKKVQQMRKGVLEMCILSLLGSGEMYASDLLKALKGAELIVVEGTIYPLLTRLKNEGLLKYRWEESSGGPPRKYYTLTDQGVQKRDVLMEQWAVLVQSVNTILKEK